MDSNSIDICVIDKPNHLIAKQFGIVLRIEIGFSRLARIQLQTLSDALSKHIQSRVCFHYFTHCLLQKCLCPIKPASEARVQIVGEINSENSSSWRRINTHVVRGVIVEHPPRIPINLMRIVISPSQLHIKPILGRHCAIVLILYLVQERWLAYLPLVRSKEENVSARAIHFVGFSRMNSLFLDGVNFECIKFHIKDLAEVHDERFVDFLPQVSSEDLDQRNFQRWDLAMHKDTCEV